jgi:hypothetical protein
LGQIGRHLDLHLLGRRTHRVGARNASERQRSAQTRKRDLRGADEPS